jgi:phage recombination protein Bet
MNTAIAVPPEQTSLIVKLASRFSVDPKKLMSTLKSTAFKQAVDRNSGKPIEPTDEEMMALLIVADQYNLNPFTREIYAFRDVRRGGIVPIVGVDGWARLINEHPMFNGATFNYGSNPEGKLEFVECTLHRKDREHATTIREYLRENKRDTDNWTNMPTRMLRHRAFIQAGRLTFGYVGIYDEDEGRAIIEGRFRRDRDASTIVAHLDRPDQAPQNTELPPPGPGDDQPLNYAEIMSALQTAARLEDLDELDATRDTANGLGDLQQIAEIDVEYRRLRKQLQQRPPPPAAA